MSSVTSAPTVSVQALRPLLDHLRRAGHEPSPLLKSSRIEPTLLVDDAANVPRAAVLALWRSAAEWTGDQALGLHVAEGLEGARFGVLGFVLALSAIVGDGLERLARYHAVIHDPPALRLSGPPEARWLTHEAPPGASPNRHISEFVLALSLRAARQASGRPIVPRQACFVHATPRRTASAELARFLGVTPVFSAARTGLCFDRATLDAPHRMAAAAPLEVLESNLRERLQAITSPVTLEGRLRALLTGDDPLSMSADDAAARVAMSPRTLRRRLAEEGTTWREVLDGVRARRALRLLRTEPPPPLADVAERLGYSEVSAFHRAFKRWYGTTPGELREDGP